MGPASQGTPTPLLSPAPGGGPQDSMGYSLSLNGAEYSSPMSGSQVCVRYIGYRTIVHKYIHIIKILILQAQYSDGSLGYDPMGHQVSDCE